jgi:hypothetical protein
MSQYDPKFLAERALPWRAEAEAFCLREAGPSRHYTPLFVEADSRAEQ